METSIAMESLRYIDVKYNSDDSVYYALESVIDAVETDLCALALESDKNDNKIGFVQKVKNGLAKILNSLANICNKRYKMLVNKGKGESKRALFWKGLYNAIMKLANWLRGISSPEKVKEAQKEVEHYKEKVDTSLKQDKQFEASASTQNNKHQQSTRSTYNSTSNSANFSQKPSLSKKESNTKYNVSNTTSLALNELTDSDSYSNKNNKTDSSNSTALTIRNSDSKKSRKSSSGNTHNKPLNEDFSNGSWKGSEYQKLLNIKDKIIIRGQEKPIKGTHKKVKILRYLNKCKKVAKDAGDVNTVKEIEAEFDRIRDDPTITNESFIEFCDKMMIDF